MDDEVSSLKFAGSTIMVVAESRQAVIDLLKDDIYVESGVWDLEKVSVVPPPRGVQNPPSPRMLISNLGWYVC